MKAIIKHAPACIIQHPGSGRGSRARAVVLSSHGGLIDQASLEAPRGSCRWCFGITIRTSQTLCASTEVDAWLTTLDYDVSTEPPLRFSTASQHSSFLIWSTQHAINGHRNWALDLWWALFIRIDVNYREPLNFIMPMYPLIVHALHIVVNPNRHQHKRSLFLN